ncbi:MAG: hypothetical protein L6Q98_14345 [Anaerolineae bacterium]|nr:hypothetical protein [Anaerolineae bacterium]
MNVVLLPSRTAHQSGTQIRVSLLLGDLLAVSAVDQTGHGVYLPVIASPSAQPTSRAGDKLLCDVFQQLDVEDCTLWIKMDAAQIHFFVAPVDGVLIHHQPSVLNPVVGDATHIVRFERGWSAFAPTKRIALRRQGLTNLRAVLSIGECQQNLVGTVVIAAPDRS